MSVKIYYSDENKEHHEALHAMFEGIPGSERDKIERYNLASAPDVAVIFGGYKPSVPHTAFRQRIMECQKLLGKQTLVIEKGYIKRGEYYAVGWGGINGHADFNNHNSPADRFEKLNITVPPTSTGKHFLLCGQVPWDSAVCDTDHIEWLRTTVVKMMELTNAEIRVRPHPDAIDNTPNFLGTEFSIGVPLAEDLAGAKAVIVYNSNTGVDAILDGKAVICLDDDGGSMYDGVSDHFIEMMNNPTGFDVSQWCNNIAYAQWTIDEMRTGEAWNHISGPVKVAA